MQQKPQKKALQKHPICLTDYTHDYIHEEIEHRDKIELEINLRDDGSEYFFTYFKSFVYFINRVMIYDFPQYVYACDISYYPIMSLILNLYLFISICYSLVNDI